jgi:hypothetical protein
MIERLPSEWKSHTTQPDLAPPTGQGLARGSQSAILSVLLLLGPNLEIAKAQYPPPTGPQSLGVPPVSAQPISRQKYPPSWYYDPYTNGSSVCPEGGAGLDPKCNVLIPPSYPAR